jgi:hypothetical protein
MTRNELIEAMNLGKDVRWSNNLYSCYLNTYPSGETEYLVTCSSNDYTIGIFHKDGIGMNIDPKECYIFE